MVLPELLGGILSGNSLENCSRVNFFRMLSDFSSLRYDILFFPPIVHILVSTCDTPKVDPALGPVA